MPYAGLLPHQKPLQPISTIPWKQFPEEQDQIKIPVRTGQATECEKTISLRVNHFPIKIKLPATIYHYVVDVTKVYDDTKAKKPETSKKGKLPGPQGDSEDQKKPLPRHLRFEIHKRLMEILNKAFALANPGKRIGIISDRSNALYATQKLELTVPMTQNVEIFSDSGRREIFHVVLAPTLERVDNKGLQKCIDNMKDVPVNQDLQRLDRIYNTLMKNLKTDRYVPIGRSSLIDFDDNAGIPLGGGLLNFKGYDATMEITNGWKPFLNIHSKILKLFVLKN